MIRLLHNQHSIILRVKQQATSKSNQITYAISAAPVGKFNPLIADTQYDEYVNGLVYASMLRLNAKIELEPALAEKYEVSKDSTVITFTLRKGLTFHDGKQLSAEDVKFTQGKGLSEKNRH